MNTLGRAFVILNLVMSIAFFTIALMVGASHENWKARALESKRLAEEQARLKIEAIKDQSEKALQVRAEQFMRAQQIAASNTQVQTLTERLNSMTEQLQTASQDKENYQNRLKESESRIAKQDVEIERLNTENSELLDRVVVAKNEVVSLTNQKYNLQNQMGLLEEREAELARQNAVLTKVTRAHNIDPTAPIANIQPRLDGEVASVDRDMNLIVVTLGLDDGLREGHRLEIFRGGKYVGSALVMKSDPNRASARLIPESMQKLVQQGDNVTTKF
jgi:ribosomal protein S15P/S13E